MCGDLVLDMAPPPPIDGGSDGAAAETRSRTTRALSCFRCFFGVAWVDLGLSQPQEPTSEESPTSRVIFVGDILYNKSMFTPHLKPRPRFYD